jgi:hypothetical protein
VTVLDTFYLLFKSDAPQATAEIAKLEKQIDALKDKGKKRSEQEKKDLKEAIAQHKELTQTVAESQKETAKFVDSIGSATAALVGFAAVRAGIGNANSFNSNLAVQSKLLQQNVRDLKVYSSAAEAAGGTKEGYLGDAGRFATDARSRGIRNPDYVKYLESVRAQLKQFTGPNAADDKRNYLNRFSYVSDSGTRNMLLDDNEWNKQIGQSNKNVKFDYNDADAAREAESTLSHYKEIIDSFFTRLSTFLGPGVTGALTSQAGGVVEGVGALWALKKLFGVAKAAVPGAGASTAAGAVGFDVVTGTAGGAIAGAAGAGALTIGGLITGAVIAGLSIFRHQQTADFLDNHGLNPFGSGSKSGPIGGDAMSILMGMGRTKEEAAAMIGNFQQESSMNPFTRGDGGKAYGIAQWHLPRVLAILKNTGIDVRTAGLADQLKAADWEMKNGDIGFDDAHFKSLSGAGAKGSYFSTNFERPLDTMGEAVKRAKNALNIVNDTPFNSMGGGSKTTSVKIDKIEVNTQATDAQGIAKGIGDQMISVIRRVVAENDDGVNS